MKIFSLLHACLFIFSKSVSRIIEDDSDSEEERKVLAFHSPTIIEFTSSSDTDEDTEILSFHCKDNRKCPGCYGWMNHCKQLIQFQLVSTEYLCISINIKARNRILLLEALKDGRKWNKDSGTEWTRFASVRYRAC